MEHPDGFGQRMAPMINELMHNSEDLRFKDTMKIYNILDAIFHVQDGLHSLHPAPDDTDEKDSLGSCFTGQEFIDWMLAEHFSKTREQAAMLGHLLILSNIIKSLSKKSKIIDEEFYRFNPAIEPSSSEAAERARSIYRAHVDYVRSQEGVVSPKAKTISPPPSDVAKHHTVRPLLQVNGTLNMRKSSDDPDMDQSELGRALQILSRVSSLLGNTELKPEDLIRARSQVDESMVLIRNAKRSTTTVIPGINEDIMLSLDKWKQKEEEKRSALLREKLSQIDENLERELQVEKEQKFFRSWMRYEPMIKRMQKHYRHLKLVLKFRAVVRQAQQSPLFQDQRRRYHLIREIISTEKTYVNSMTVIISNFVVPFRAIVDLWISQQDLQIIFSNIESILHCNQTLLKELEYENIMHETRIGQSFLHLAPFFKMYSQYISNYQQSTAVLQETMKIEAFQSFVTRCEREAKSKLGAGADSSLSSLLLLPIQRIPRYVLLLEALEKCTLDENHDKPNLMSALHQIRIVADQVNENSRKEENRQKVVQIQHELAGDFDLVAPHRIWIREGVLKMSFPESEVTGSFYYYCFLFNDLLLATQPIHPDAHHPTIDRSRSRSFIRKMSLENLEKQYQFKGYFQLRNISAENLDKNPNIDFVNSFQIKYSKSSGKAVISSDDPKVTAQWMQDIMFQHSQLLRKENIVQENVLGGDRVKPTIKEGNMTKQGGRIKTWRKRWFRLKGKTLFYFVDSSSTEVQGSIPLNGYNVDTNASELEDGYLGWRYHYIRLVPNDSRMRTYFMYPDTVEEQESWVRAIREAIMAG
eukprot:TRINITY_DN9942_c0_g1_i2.p1 TRINITY_DN9942_c0_g1~~TRINITY_DN9942_c0_g1_i2.p1  ORF type:complete len:828 (+),score=248.48 TRINITY_DN9942_c0_g1_i2:51-2486(+)